MPDNLAEQLSPEEIRETAMVDLAFDILKSKGEPMLYRDLMKEVARLKGFSEEEIDRFIAQLYTEINIDGRFICVGKSLWGLKRWYPTEQASDSAVAQNVKDDFTDEDLEEEDIFDEEVDAYDEDVDVDGEEYDEYDDEAFDGDDEALDTPDPDEED